MQTQTAPKQESPTLGLIDHVQARREELTRALAGDAASKATRADIEGALAALTPMLTGDLTKVPEMVSRDLSRWLEANKYLGVSNEPAAPGAKPSTPSVPSMSALSVPSTPSNASLPAVTSAPSLPSMPAITAEDPEQPSAAPPVVADDVSTRT